MTAYFVSRNAEANGDHEVHTEGCAFLPLISSRIFLGRFARCEPAVSAAGENFDQVDGCYFCSRPCHTG